MTEKRQLTKEEKDAVYKTVDKVFPTTAAMIGGAIGSVVPVVGTAVGVGIGTGVGYALRLRNVMKNGFKKDED